MEENTNIFAPAEVAEDAQNTEIVENTEEQVAENCEIAEESVEDTEETQENEEKTPAKAKVEPLPEQKPFLMSPYERAILEEMERRASDNPALAEGLKNKDKNIGECFAFVTNRAKKMATSNCAMIADSEVYAWAQFYYTQRREIIELEYKSAPKPTTTATTTTKAKTTAKTQTAAATAKKAEEKPKNPNIEEVKGADGKTHTIEHLSLF